jgi:regulator of RNase E activity RraA
MMELKERIIRQIQENKISTTQVADVLGKKGALKGILPINPRHYRVGEVVFVYAYKESNWEVHEQISSRNCEGKIVYIHGIECADRAIIGDLVSKYLFLYKNCKAIVMNAPVRDAHTIIKENYPIWCISASPIGCTNIKNETLPPDEMLAELRRKYDKGIMVCDDSGVVVIPEEEVKEQMIEKLNFIELQEDIWFFCIDTLKMSVYDVVCLKKYLNESLVDEEKLIQLSKFTTAH